MKTFGQQGQCAGSVEEERRGEERRMDVPPDEGLEGLDAVLPQLVIVHVTELHHQRDDLLQVLT